MKDHKLSNQAIGAIMMALQKSLMEQSDVVPVLKNFNVQVDDTGELVVTNPPKVEAKTHATNSPVLKGPLQCQNIAIDAKNVTLNLKQGMG